MARGPLGVNSSTTLAISQPALIGRLVELEVDSPDLVGGTVASVLLGDGRAQLRRLLAGRHGPPQAHRSATAVSASGSSCAEHAVPSRHTDGIGRLPAPARVLSSGDPLWRNRDRSWPVSWLRPALAHPEALDEHGHRPSAKLWSHHFPRRARPTMALSSSAPARSFLSRAFLLLELRRPLGPSSAILVPPGVCPGRLGDPCWRRTLARSCPAGIEHPFALTDLARHLSGCMRFKPVVSPRAWVWWTPTTGGPHNPGAHHSQERKTRPYASVE